jgi:hypothetical protein
MCEKTLHLPNTISNFGFLNNENRRTSEDCRSDQFARGASMSDYTNAELEWHLKRKELRDGSDAVGAARKKISFCKHVWVAIKYDPDLRACWPTRRGFDGWMGALHHSARGTV